jgi:DNA-binding response OmpR family regulator
MSATLKVLVYSDDASLRAQVLAALGTRVAPELPRLEFVEVATEPVVIRTLDAGNIDLVILDGEAHPAGGLGVCRQIKDEIFQAPPVIVLTGRPQDAWLATWSRAEGVVPQPIDPVVLAETAGTLLRQRVATTV